MRREILECGRISGSLSLDEVSAQLESSIPLGTRLQGFRIFGWLLECQSRCTHVQGRFELDSQALYQICLPCVGNGFFLFPYVICATF